jgi:hypothetical protein
LSGDQRFGLLLLAITTAVALLGWFMRTMIAGMREETAANTRALAELTREFEQYRLQVAERTATEAQAEAAELRSRVGRPRRRWILL